MEKKIIVTGRRSADPSWDEKTSGTYATVKGVGTSKKGFALIFTFTSAKDLIVLPNQLADKAKKLGLKVSEKEEGDSIEYTFENIDALHGATFVVSKGTMDVTR